MIAYDLLQRELSGPAAATGETRTRLSFVMALHYVQSELQSMALRGSKGKLPDKLRQLREKLKLMRLDEKRGRFAPVKSKRHAAIHLYAPTQLSERYRDSSRRFASCRK